MNETSVRDILFDPSGDGRRQVAGQLAVASVLPAVILAFARPGEVAEAVWDLLDMPIGNVVLSAWDKHRAVERAKAETALAPGSRTQVRAHGHTLRSTHHPRVECDVNGRSIPVLTLDLQLALQIDAIVLTIADGRIVEVSPAEATVAASLSAGAVPLARERVARVSLPAWEASPLELGPRGLVPPLGQLP